ncbi:MAG: pectin acetylesterase-family hydrolase [Bacteroidales bacterium]
MKATTSLFLILFLSVITLTARTSDRSEWVIECGDRIQNTLASQSNHAYIELDHDHFVYGLINKETMDAVGDSLPDLIGLDDGWNTLYPSGETTCALGDDFHFWVRAADRNRLVVYLYGGGGCWDAETCDPERESYTYTSTIEPAMHPAEQNGIFDLDHPDNPVAGYSFVAVPVCTGDAFLGDRDVTYTLKTDSGETRQFKIHHRGQTNTMAVMDWIYANFESPQEIFVAGSSAGSIGTPFYASLLAQHYPEARVAGLGDDSGSYGSEAMTGSDVGQWGIPDVMRRHRGWEEFEDNAGIEKLYIHAARSVPNLGLYQFDHAHDEAQRFYLELANAELTDVSHHLRANRQSILEQVPEFRSFTAGGYQHTVLTRETFYHYHTNGHPLRDWVAAVVAGESVASVDCGDDCGQPGLIYSEQDLRIINNTIELLSKPGTWNPTDVPGPCPTGADQYSLRCAAAEIAQQVTGHRPSGYNNVPPALLDLIFTITDRLPDRQQGNPLGVYNNQPDTTVADMIALLEEVRERIRTNLSDNR